MNSKARFSQAAGTEFVVQAAERCWKRSLGEIKVWGSLSVVLFTDRTAVPVTEVKHPD